MRIVRQMLILLIGIFIFGGSLSADVLSNPPLAIEAYPGLNHIGAFKISKNMPMYAGRLNFAAIEENGKIKVYPIPTQLTKKYLANMLYYSTLKFADITKFNENINNISNLQKSLQNPTDPINIIRSIKCNLESKDVNKCMVDTTPSKLDGELNSFFMAVVQLAVEGKKSA